MENEQQKQHVAQDQGAPAILMTSLLVGFPLQSLLLMMPANHTSPSPSWVLAGYSIMGLGICFYWRRLAKSWLKTISLLVFLAGYWLFMAAATGLQVVASSGWLPKVSMAGLGALTLCGLLFIFTWNFNQKPGSRVWNGLASAMGLAFLGVFAAFNWPLSHKDISQTLSAKHPHWSYEGEAGPENWGKLDEEYAACTNGQEQSPIDISRRARSQIQGVNFKYKPSGINAVDNGRTVQFTYDPGSAAVFNGQRYELKQFHFHAPAEHTLNGVVYPAEIHFVHQNDKGELAVLGLFVEKGDYHPVWDTVISFFPHETHKQVEQPAIKFSAAQLLPQRKKVYQYRGSLTTPPCTEGVFWNVLADPIELSQAQVASLIKHYHNNNRPIQPINTRIVGELPVPSLAH